MMNRDSAENPSGDDSRSSAPRRERQETHDADAAEAASSHATHAELACLLSELLDGDPTCDGKEGEDGSLRLEQILRADPAARQFYLQYIDQHARLLVRFREQNSTPGEDPSGIDASPKHATESDTIVPQPGHVVSSERWMRAEWVRLLLVAAGSFAASLCLQLNVWSSLAKPSPDAGRQTGASTAAEGQPGEAVVERMYVATVARLDISDALSAGDSPSSASRFKQGMRLLPGRFRLTDGRLELYMDGGVQLLFDGPAAFQIGSATHISLTSGTCVVASDDTATACAVTTPQAELQSFGGDYGVIVQDSIDEVHVLAGEVVRRPLRGEPAVTLSPGMALRFHADKATGETVPLLGDLRSRHSWRSETPKAATLLAVDSFAYPETSRFPAPDRPTGGRGWLYPWRKGSHWPAVRLRRDVSLVPELDADSKPDGWLETDHPAILARQLAQSLSASQDQIVYFSFLFQRELPKAGPPNAVQLVFKSLASGSELRTGVYTNVDGQLAFCRIAGTSVTTPLPIRYGESYLFAGKMVLARDNPDQVFISILSPSDPLHAQEPRFWMLTSPSIDTDVQFDTVVLQFKGSSVQRFDDLRIGTSWASVVAPWTHESVPADESSDR